MTLKTSVCDELTQLEEGMIPSQSPLRRNATIPCFELNTSTSSSYSAEHNAVKSVITLNDEKKGTTKSPHSSSKGTGAGENRKISDYFQRLKKK